MYESFYHLSADPFRLSPDPRFCFEHPSFSRARKYMQYALRRAEGFIMVTGRPGTGKTTLVESLLSGLAGGGPIAARLVSAQLKPDELLRKVAYGFGLRAQAPDKATLLDQLERFLVQHTRTGRGALLVVDEAQGLSAPALEELRLLTNLQEAGRPVLQIFLVGQEQLREVVQAPELEQFHQRLIAACHLRPLDLEETRAYVEHRLRRVGWRGRPQLSGDAILMVHRFSAGVPRRINQVCSRLLLHGAAEELERLDGQDVVEVIEDLRQEVLTPADLPETAELRDLLATAPPMAEPEPLGCAPPDSGRPEPAAGDLPPPPPAATGAGAPPAAMRADTRPAGPGDEPGRPADAASGADLPPEAAAHPRSFADGAVEPLGLPTASGLPAKADGRVTAGRPMIGAPRPPRTFGRRVALALGLVGLAGGLLYGVAPELTGPRLAGLADRLGAWHRSTRPATSAPGEVPRSTPLEAAPADRSPPERLEAGTPSAATGAPPSIPDPSPPAAVRPPPAAPPATTGPTLAPVAVPATPVAVAFPLPEVAGVAADGPVHREPEPAGPRQAHAPTPSAGPLERALAGLGLTVRPLEDGAIHLDLRREVPFERNSAQVGLDSQAFLSRLAEVLRGQEGYLIEVVGLTDDSGSREHNAALARRRAEAVMAYLLRQGLPASRLRAQGPSDPSPSREATGAAPADLRRIDLYIRRAPADLDPVTTAGR